MWTPSETGSWGWLPFDQEYVWVGNNYKLISDLSCANPNDGGQVLVGVGSGTQAQIKNFLGTGADLTKELHAANVSTPLAGALQTAFSYYNDPQGVARTDAQKHCRGNYILLVTDGGEACLVDITVPGQKALALMNLTDPPGGVKTYVVGIDQGGLSNDGQTVLSDMANKGGTGNYYSASDATSLMNALQIIIGQILSQTYTFSPITSSFSRYQDNTMAIQGSMLPNVSVNRPFWRGDLKAYKLKADGTLAQTRRN